MFNFLNNICILILFTISYITNNYCPDFINNILLKLIQKNVLLVKIFQYISLKLPELKVKKYIENLQDKCDIHDMEYNKQIFKKFGYNIDDLFIEFNEIPIASASIAQVHKAILKNGKEVAVKIKHPNIKELILKESLIINNFIKTINYIYNKLNINYTIPLDFDVFKDSIIIETDFINEFNNIKSLYYKLDNPNIIIPEPFFAHDDFIVMSYESGEKSSEYLKNNKTDIQNTVLILFIFIYEMAYIHNLLHTDLHNGNWSIRDNKLIIYDFGNVINFSDRLFKKYLLKLTMLGNYIELLDLIIIESKNIIKNEEIIKKITNDIINLYDISYKGIPIMKIVDIASKYKIYLRTDLIQLIKIFTISEEYGYKYNINDINIKSKKIQANILTQRYLEFTKKNNMNQEIIDLFEEGIISIKDYDENLEKFNNIINKMKQYNKIDIDNNELYLHINSYLGMLYRYGVSYELIINKIKIIFELLDNDKIIKRYSDILYNNLINKSIYKYKLDFMNDLVSDKQDIIEYINDIKRDNMDSSFNKLINNITNYKKIHSNN